MSSGVISLGHSCHDHQLYQSKYKTDSATNACRKLIHTHAHTHARTHACAHTHTHTHTHTRTHTRTCSKDARQVLLAHCRSGPAGVSSEPPPALPPPHTGEEISYAFFIAVAFLCSRYSLALIKRILQMHLHIKARALASEHTASLA